MKSKLTIAILLFWIGISAQNTFNLRYHFGYPASVLTSIEVTDSCYYATGVFADSVFPYKKSNIFAKFDLYGNLIHSKILANPDKTYETWANTLQLTDDGNFINGGYSVDSTMKMIFIKYNSEGDTLFTREYFNPFYPLSSFIVFEGMVTDPADSSHIITCSIEHPLYQTYCIYLLKIKENGDVVWDKVLYHDIDLRNTPSTIEILPNSKYIIGGKIHKSSNNNFIFRTYIFQVDSLGEMEWEYLSPAGELQNSAFGMLPTPDGGLVIASGKGVEFITGPNSMLLFNHYVYKLDADRNFEWGVDIRDSFPSPNNVIYKLIASPDGSGYVCAGQIFEYTGGGGYNENGVIAKVSTEGDSLWTRYYNYVDSPADTHAFYDLEATADGGYVMVGQATDHFTGGESPLQQAWIVKVDEYGCLVPDCHLSSVDDIKINIKLDLYPNPARDYLNVFYYDPAHSGEVHFRIVDVQGRVMQSFSSRVNDITHIISLSGYAAGQYFLQAEVRGEVVSKAFVVGIR